MALLIRPVDPQGPDALALLAEAAREARALYADVIDPAAPPASNPPAAPRTVYLVAYLDGAAVGCGALRPIDEHTAEVRRMYVLPQARGRGVARAVLARLEAECPALGYRVLRLETGNRQRPAMALYEACGFERIAAFGPYVGDPLSVCFEKQLAR